MLRTEPRTLPLTAMERERWCQGGQVSTAATLSHQHPSHLPLLAVPAAQGSQGRGITGTHNATAILSSVMSNIRGAGVWDDVITRAC